MIVPSSRLLFWVLAALPFTITGALVPDALVPSVMVLALLVSVVAIDALSAVKRPHAVEASYPDVVRFSKNRPGAIPITLTCSDPAIRAIDVGIPLPPEFASPTSVLSVMPPAHSERAKADWPCTPRSRGRFSMARCHLGVPSRLGFWEGRRTCESRIELRVYPNLLTERNRIASLFLNRGLSGIHAQRMIGQGRDFEQLREYVHGDSYEDIHWKATARHAKLFTKVYQIERTQEVYVVLDSSRLSSRMVGQDSALDGFITASLVLGLAAEQQGDHFGVLTFSDGLDRFIRARSGKAHFASCRDALYTLSARNVTPDFNAACSFIRTRLRKRALLIFLTDLLDPVLKESFLHNMQLINRQHLILVNMIGRPGLSPVFSSPVDETAADLHRRLSSHILWNQLRELEATLRNMGIALTQLENARMTSQIVAQYMRVKRRQVL